MLNNAKIKKEKNVTKPMKGHFDKAGVPYAKTIIEFRNFNLAKKLGDDVSIEDVFAVGDLVSAIGTTKGKGFQGVVKRHNFKGVGDATHGQHNRQRAPGSIGAGSYPARVFKGMRMSGRMGVEKITTQNLVIQAVDAEKNLLLIKGSLPGTDGSLIFIRSAAKKALVEVVETVGA